MKKKFLIAVIALFIAALCSVFAACSEGQTHGGDNVEAPNIERNAEEQTDDQEEQPPADDKPGMPCPRHDEEKDDFLKDGIPKRKKPRSGHGFPPPQPHRPQPVPENENSL